MSPPNNRSTQHRQPKKGRGLSRNSHWPMPHIMRRHISVQAYLMALRLAPMSSDRVSIIDQDAAWNSAFRLSGAREVGDGRSFRDQTTHAGFSPFPSNH